MKSLLPVFRSDQEYHACNHTEEMYLPAMREVCAKHDISHSKLTRFEEGESAIVFSIDNDQLPVPEWAEFVRHRCAACQGHQARGGVHEFLVEQVPSFMEAYLPDPNAVTCSAILHTELTREAWYIERANGSWILSGLFDFGDVLIGDPGADCLWREFDLSLLRSNLAAYGYEDGVFADANLIEKVTFDFFGNWTHWRGHRKTWLVRLKANYQFTKKWAAGCMSSAWTSNC